MQTVSTSSAAAARARVETRRAIPPGRRVSRNRAASRIYTDETSPCFRILRGGDSHLNENAGTQHLDRMHCSDTRSYSNLIMLNEDSITELKQTSEAD